MIRTILEGNEAQDPGHCSMYNVRDHTFKFIEKYDFIQLWSIIPLPLWSGNFIFVGTNWCYCSFCTWIRNYGWLKTNTRRLVHWYFFVALCKLHVLSDVFEYTPGVMGEEMMQSGSLMKTAIGLIQSMIQFLCSIEKVEKWYW